MKGVREVLIIALFYFSQIPFSQAQDIKPLDVFAGWIHFALGDERKSLGSSNGTESFIRYFVEGRRTRNTEKLKTAFAKAQRDQITRERVLWEMALTEFDKKNFSDAKKFLDDIHHDWFENHVNWLYANILFVEGNPRLAWSKIQKVKEKLIPERWKGEFAYLSNTIKREVEEFFVASDLSIMAGWTSNAPLVTVPEEEDVFDVPRSDLFSDVYAKLVGVVRKRRYTAIFGYSGSADFFTEQYLTNFSYNNLYSRILYRKFIFTPRLWFETVGADLWDIGARLSVKREIRKDTIFVGGFLAGRSNLIIERGGITLGATSEFHIQRKISSFLTSASLLADAGVSLEGEGHSSIFISYFAEGHAVMSKLLLSGQLGTSFDFFLSRFAQRNMLLLFLVGAGAGYSSESIRWDVIFLRFSANISDPFFSWTRFDVSTRFTLVF